MEFKSASYIELKSLCLYQAFDISKVRGSVTMSWFILHSEHSIRALKWPLTMSITAPLLKLGSIQAVFSEEFLQSAYKRGNWILEVFHLKPTITTAKHYPKHKLHSQRIRGKGALETSWSLMSVHWWREYFWHTSTWRGHVAKEERWDLEVPWQAFQKVALVPVPDPTVLFCATSTSRSQRV